ncbi:Acyl-CoA N-acyltransferase [Penicillium macrosclerotiorum]|uniref:Acyl-CoA N-acyltransferase n=1 Tax=Penicillium macrosclerotiorum TaxID=303699 RepID=UPI002548501A|nr:Acyl-CoA N-acyltransferase [Penicillium macrosclerotiorum]KAJ5674171.1 Acyl-CoA N-acyltransferase [Penicillium macrosclerotiorum]
MASTELQKKVGQLFAVGFHGHTPSLEIKTLIHDYHVGGIVLFSRNFQNAAQLQALTLALQNEARLAGHQQPLFIAIDQENGLVTRVSPPIAPQVPGPMALGGTHSPELAYEAGKATGEILTFFGINMNYAPVCDINSEPLNPVIGVRSPGDDPEFVGRFASATARGLREKKIIPSIKHFPGHGDTAVDSHYGLPVIPKTRDELERCELIPFRRAVAEQIETVMTAHISLPYIDDKLPATLSPAALGILRKDMAYDGMVITDCLEMDGVRSTFGTEQGSVLALQAGSDSIMICHTFEVQVNSIRKVCEAVQSGAIEPTRLEEACRRVARVKNNFTNWDAALHQPKIAEMDALSKRISLTCQEAYERSVTLVRDSADVLPLSKNAKIVFLFPGDETPAGGAVDGQGTGRRGSYEATVYLETLRRHNPSIREIRYGQGGLSDEQLSSVKAADAVILVTINARESPYQEELGKLLPQCASSLVSIAACNPYDFLDTLEVQTYLATYEPTIEAFSVAADIIFGTKFPKGSLPVGPTATKKPDVSVTPYNSEKDVNGILSAWTEALPTYTLSAEQLRPFITRDNAYHYVARVGSELVGFCLAYTNAHGDPKTVHIAVLAVVPRYQGQGIGTALLTETRSNFRKKFGIYQVKLGSSFPRFWPGIPRDLPESVQEFFVHRGFRLSPPQARSVDLFQDIRNFQSPEKYINRARERGFRFAPLQPQDYEGCLVGQRRNFSDKAGWVEAYVTLHPSEYPDCVMAAFDAQGEQVGWTLMLPPLPQLNQVWAFPQTCGPKTGLIGAVGVDESHRKSGIGLAMICHAVENMKQRGIQGVFVDWVALDGWYEQVGFKTWRSYRPGET